MSRRRRPFGVLPLTEIPQAEHSWLAQVKAQRAERLVICQVASGFLTGFWGRRGLTIVTS